MIALGFVLTLAATAVGLVPPYLTMPLLDRVLIPYEGSLPDPTNGLPVQFGLVYWYLGGMALAAAVGLAARLGPQLYVLAWVSERISADLRDRTYAHLQRLSVEFFGGKRTGDLMLAIGSDTDRLCNFLSLNLVDFATDMLMIVHDGGRFCLTIDPLLALATLRPFPLIVWLVVWVRGRLLRGYFRPGRRGLGDDDQRAGRHHPRHPRRQGVRPGRPRDRALPPATNA